MADTKYSDKRSTFFAQWFERGQRYDEYLESAPSNHAQKWRAFESRITLTASDRDLLSAFRRKLNLLVLAGVWCGDCARQGPILHAISQVAPQLQLRFIDNRLNPELAEELRINGAEKVPVVVALSEDFFELQRFGDRHLSVYRSKAAAELGPACDSGLLGPSDHHLETEIREWIEFVERLELLLRLAPALRKRYGD